MFTKSFRHEETTPSQNKTKNYINQLNNVKI